MFDTKELRRGNVTLRVANGHFATTHSHINYYIDITNQKTRLADAKAAAAELAKHYSNIPVDTILCMDGMGLVGACLADALTANRRSVSTAEEGIFHTLRQLRLHRAEHILLHQSEKVGKGKERGCIRTVRKL